MAEFTTHVILLDVHQQKHGDKFLAVSATGHQKQCNILSKTLDYAKVSLWPKEDWDIKIWLKMTFTTAKGETLSGGIYRATYVRSKDDAFLVRD